MLSDMRKRVRVVMFIVAAAFIAGFLMSELWRMIGTRGSRRGRDTHGFVGRVGDHNVTPEEYRAAVSYVTDKYKSDNIERVVVWKENNDVSSLAGRAIRLRFVLNDADLYAIRFK